MDPIDKFLKLYSYKFPKGHININDPQDVLLLENILKEEFDIVLESATDDTETLHEIFTAMFVAGHKPIQFTDIREVNWDKVEFGPLLKDPNKHKEGIKKYINSSTKDEKAKKYKSLYDDAEALAKSLIEKFPPAEVTRIFSDTKKTKADIEIKQADESFKNPLGVSLKYKDAQFNSLSPSAVLNNLFGLQLPPKGVLGYLASNDADSKKKIDGGVQSYLNFILDNFERIETEGKGRGGDTEAYLNDTKYNSPEVLKKIKDKGTITIKKGRGKNTTFEEKNIEDMTWEDYKKVPKEIQKPFSRAYNAYPLTTDRSKDGGFLSKKKESINSVLLDYINEISGIDLRSKKPGEPAIIEIDKEKNEKIAEFVGLILGSEEKSYYYIANPRGGMKYTFIPSFEALKKFDYIVKAEYDEKSSDFVIDLEIFAKNKDKGTITKMFGTDVRLRFQDGQFTSDITQKGSKFDIGKNGEEININKLFGFK